jgi:hypothetical protein
MSATPQSILFGVSDKPEKSWNRQNSKQTAKKVLFNLAQNK